MQSKESEILQAFNDAYNTTANVFKKVEYLAAIEKLETYFNGQQKKANTRTKKLIEKKLEDIAR